MNIPLNNFNYKPQNVLKKISLYNQEIVLNKKVPNKVTYKYNIYNRINYEYLYYDQTGEMFNYKASEYK